MSLGRDQLSYLLVHQWHVDKTVQFALLATFKITINVNETIKL